MAETRAAPRPAPDAVVDGAEADALLVLVGITAGWAKRRAIRRLLTRDSPWPVIVPWLPYALGLNAAASWLNRGLRRRLPQGARLQVLSYIGGAGVLRQLKIEGRAPRIARLVLDRGPIQELVPAALASRVPHWLVIALGGKGMLDLAAQELTLHPLPPVEAGSALIVETEPSWVARRLGLDRAATEPLDWDPARLLPGAQAVLVLPLSHDQVYGAPDFARAALHFLRFGAFPPDPRSP